MAGRGKARDGPPASVARPRGAGAGQLERGAHRLYIHVAWTTLGKMPLLGAGSRRAVELHLRALCRRLGAEPMAVRASAARVHVVARIRPSQDVGRLVTRLKRGSEAGLCAEGVPAVWGGGYAATTVGPPRLPRLLRRLEAAARVPRRSTGDRRGTDRG